MKRILLIFLFIVILQPHYTTSDDETVWGYNSKDIINSISISSDGSYVAIGTENKNVILLSNHGKILWSNNIGGEVEAVSISQDGNYVVTSTSGYLDNQNVRRVDGTIYLFSITGNLLWKYTTGPTLDSEVYTISITKDGNYVAAGTSGGTLYLLSKSGELLWYYKMGARILSINTTFDGASIVVVLENNQIVIISNNRDILGRFESSGDIISTSTSSDGSYIVLGTKLEKNGISKGNVTLLSRSTELLWDYETNDECYSVYISQKYPFIVATSGKEAYLFSKSGKLLWIYELTEKAWSSSISRDGTFIAIGQTGRIDLLSNKGEVIWSKHLEDKIDFLDITSKGNIIALDKENNKIYEFNPKIPVKINDILLSLSQVLLFILFLIIGLIITYTLFIKYRKWDEKLLQTNISLKISIIFFFSAIIIFGLNKIFILGMLSFLILALSLLYAFGFLIIFLSKDRIFKKYYSWECYKEQKINPVISSAKQNTLVFLSHIRVPEKRKE